MTGFIIFIIIFIVLGIFVAVFRLGTLATFIKSNEDKEANVRDIAPSNTIHAVLFVLVPLIGLIWCGVYAYKNSDVFILPHASLNSSMTVPLFWTAIGIISAMFLITNFLLFFFSFKYRYNKNRKAHFYPDNTKLEIIWTIVPAIVLTTLIFSGWRAWRKIMSDSPEGAQRIEIMGYQFAWDVRYAGKDNKIGASDFRYVSGFNNMGLDFTDKKNNDDFMANEIHIVKGKPVEIMIRARDVIHSVSMPHFRQKMDAVPGMPTRMWIQPTMTTKEMRDSLSKIPSWQEIDPKSEKPRYEGFNFEIACQEICGKGHFSMRKIIIVETQKEYDEWLALQKPFVEMNKEKVAKAIKMQQKVKKGLKHSVSLK